MKVIEGVGYKLGEDIFFVLDVVFIEFFWDGVYYLEGEGKKLSLLEMVDYWEELVG